MATAKASTSLYVGKEMKTTIQLSYLLILLMSFVGCTDEVRLRDGQRFSDWESPNAIKLNERILKNSDDASAHYWKGYSASHIKDVKTVHKSYKTAISLEPENEWFKISYGWALFNAEEYNAALRQWLRAYDFSEGKHNESEITLALGYYGIGDYRNAASHYQRQTENDKAFRSFTELADRTAGWTWKEKNAIFHLYDIWRYTYND